MANHKDAALGETIISQIDRQHAVISCVAADPDRPSREQRRACTLEYQKLYALYDRGYRLFGQLNGWKFAKQPFRPETLGKHHSGESVYFGGSEYRNDHWIDHHECYRESVRPYYAVAFVSQPYGDEPDWLRPMLERQGLVLQMPPRPRASIYYPGATLFLVVTRPGVEVKWLPEQVRGYEDAAEWQEARGLYDERRARNAAKAASISAEIAARQRAETAAPSLDDEFAAAV